VLQLVHDGSCFGRYAATFRWRMRATVVCVQAPPSLV
jgi:hypothetical protein